jgi:RNA polymerase sporulation-specific sigma factor
LPDTGSFQLPTLIPMIAGEIRRYLRDNSSVRVSRSMRDTAYRVLQTKEKLTAEKQREPDISEIAAALGIPRQEVFFAMDAISEPVSIYEPVFSDGGESICVMDQIGDSKNTDDTWIERIALSEAIKSLDGREKRILALRFYDGKTQMEVAEEVGISQAQVSRLEKSAIGQIKKCIGLE